MTRSIPDLHVIKNSDEVALDVYKRQEHDRSQGYAGEYPYSGDFSKF